MKDFLGRDLAVGDEVVFIQLGYRNLLRGRIIKITAKTVLIEHAPAAYSTQTKQFHDQVVKIS